MMERKLMVYIACSLDGYIAAPGDDLSFLDAVALEGEDYGYTEFYKTIDTVLIGRRTYDWVTAKVPGYSPDKPTYIISRTPQASKGNVIFYNGNPADLVRQLKTRTGLHIFCDGGAELIDSLLMEDLVDEIIISFIPVLLGNGTRLFKDGRGIQKLSLVSAASFESGLVQLRYARARS